MSRASPAPVSDTDADESVVTSQMNGIVTSQSRDAPPPAAGDVMKSSLSGSLDEAGDEQSEASSAASNISNG